MHIYDVIIIGGGPSGYSAALYAARSGLDVLLTEKLSAGGQMALTDEIDNYPGFNDGIDGFLLGLNMQQGAERFGAKTEYTDITGVDFSEKIKKIYSANGEYRSRSVILSVGAYPRELGIKNEKEYLGKGVHYCAHCDGRFYKDKTVAVIGGGNSAVQDALYLSRLAKKVYLIHRRDTLKATKIYQTALKEAENIEFIGNTTVKELIAESKVKGIRATNLPTGKEVEIVCDGIFISIGRIPATDFLSEAVALDENGYIIADETTKTDKEGVFAAGDVRTKALRQIVTAAADGAVAAHFAEEYLSALRDD